MALETIWFAILALLFAVFFVLEGFDYGVGLLVPVIGRDADERSRVVSTIAPFWDANEVWLIAAGATMFAVFPLWYAALFSGFYLVFFSLLVLLVVRGVAFEFRGELGDPRWTAAWDTALAATSGSAAFLWGFLMASLLRGVPLGPGNRVLGSPGSLVHPFPLLGGLTTLALFTLHGANFLQLRLDDGLRARARRVALWAGGVATALGAVFVVALYLATPVVERVGVSPGLLPLAAGGSLVSIRVLLDRERPGWAFATGCGTIALATLTVFSFIHPLVLPAVSDAGAGLTIEEAAAGDRTLWAALAVVGVLLPVVVAYQAWSYRVLLRRLGADDAAY